MAVEMPGLGERVGWLKDELQQIDERKWNPEHDVPHLHRAKTGQHAFRDDDIHGAASQYDIHELRRTVADLAAFVEKIAELCDMRAAEGDRLARRQSAVLNGMDPDV